MGEPTHFKGKEAIQHVVEAQSEGVCASAESHGTETPGHLSCGAATAKEVAIALLLLSVILPSNNNQLILIGLFALSWILWRIGRTAWMGWARLERLHRLVEQEKWEIENHRGQERQELAALYAAKGFEGELLEEVVDVLMADGDRLLKVMLEEELGLKLEVHEHPLKLGAGAGIGGMLSALLCLILSLISTDYGLQAGAFASIAGASGFAAYYEGNRVIPAMIWNIGIGAFGFGGCYFLSQWLAG